MPEDMEQEKVVRLLSLNIDCYFISRIRSYSLEERVITESMECADAEEKTQTYLFRLPLSVELALLWPPAIAFSSCRLDPVKMRR